MCSDNSFPGFVGAFLFMLFLPCAYVLADESDVPYSLDPLTITITSSRIPTDIKHSTDNVTVITQDDITSMNPSGMPDLLSRLPGVHVDQSRGASISSVYVRGSDPNFTVVLIDGVKFNDPTNTRGGSYDFSTLEISNIERIEIVTGPHSSIYGSDAMGGVINIITRDAGEKTETLVHAEAGTNEEIMVNMNLLGRVASSGSFSVSLGHSDKGEPIPGDKSTDDYINGKFSWEFDDNINLDSVLRFSKNERNNFPEESGGPELASIREVDQRKSEELSVGMNLNHQKSNSLGYELSFNRYLRSDDSLSPGVAPGVRDPFGIPVNSFNNKYHRNTFRLNGLLSLSRNIKTAVGLERQTENGSSDSLLSFGVFDLPGTFDLQRNQNSFYTEMQYLATNYLTLQGGVRADDPDDLKRQYSPRLGINYRSDNSKSTIRLNWGKGFKLPSFFALGNPIVGNPDLKPEENRNTEIGFTQQLSDNNTLFEVNLFKNKINNIVDFDEGPPPQLVNRSEVIAQGGEIRLVSLLGMGFRISTFYAITNTEITGSDEKLRNRPRRSGGLTVNWTVNNKLRINATNTYIGKTLDSSIATGDLVLDSFHRVDLNASWQFDNDITTVLSIDNLLDKEYQHHIGFPEPGISARVSVKASL